MQLGPSSSRPLCQTVEVTIPEAKTSRLKLLLIIATVLGLAFAARKYLDSEALLEAWHKFSWDVWGYLLLLPALYLLFKAVRFSVLLRSASKVKKTLVMYGYASSQAASLLPGGVAMRAAMMHRLGVPVEDSSGPILANSAADQILLLSVGLGLCYYYPTFRPSAFVITAILLTLVVCLSRPTPRGYVKSLLHKLAAKFDRAERVESFFENLRSLTNLQMWLHVMFWTFLANLASVVSLCLVVGALGFEVQPWPLTAAFVIPNLLGRLSPLPAGAGVTEAGMVGFMAAQTAMSYEQAAVATIIFRVVDIMLPALYGGLCQVFFLRRDDQGDRKAGVVEAA